MPSARIASRSPPAGERLTKKPPLEPTGTMTVFLTICALTRPSTSVRKSSRRSDQRRPPRATGPKRRCTPSPRGRDRLHLRIALLATCVDDRVDDGRVVLVHRLRQQRLELLLQALARALEHGLARRFAIGIELGFEQFDQQAGDQRIAVER